jgi:hypothetical protein
MHQPYYFRAPEYRYTLRSDMAYCWWTGVIRGELQFLRSVGATVTFDRAGELVRVAGIEDYPIPTEWRNDPRASERVRPEWAVTLEFEECPIRVRRFWVAELWLGVEDMPEMLSEFFTNQKACLDHGDVRPEDPELWKASDQFVFHCGCGDYWLNSRGDVVSS